MHVYWYNYGNQAAKKHRFVGLIDIYLTHSAYRRLAWAHQTRGSAQCLCPNDCRPGAGVVQAGHCACPGKPGQSRPLARRWPIANARKIDSARIALRVSKPRAVILRNHRFVPHAPLVKSVACELVSLPKNPLENAGHASHNRAVMRLVSVIRLRRKRSC